MKIKFVFGVLLLVFIPALAFSQTNKTESLSFTTYFPSPDAVFTRMEVRNKLIVGNISDSHTSGITSINDITKDQVFVADSIILGSQTTQPSIPRDGQLYFNNSTAPGGKTLEFYNGTGTWQKLGS
ncbi:MAG: hypothetical protein NTY14_01850 [Candidatus Omnitrophica bacterium]|nr:hypothetical protein [Candidatus Omnitrophota bacterium]